MYILLKYTTGSLIWILIHICGHIYVYVCIRRNLEWCIAHDEGVGQTGFASSRRTRNTCDSHVSARVTMSPGWLCSCQLEWDLVAGIGSNIRYMTLTTEFANHSLIAARTGYPKALRKTSKEIGQPMTRSDRRDGSPTLALGHCAVQCCARGRRARPDRAGWVPPLPPSSTTHSHSITIASIHGCLTQARGTHCCSLSSRLISVSNWLKARSVSLLMITRSRRWPYFSSISRAFSIISFSSSSCEQRSNKYHKHVFSNKITDTKLDPFPKQ